MTALLHAFDTSLTKTIHDNDTKIWFEEISHYLTHVSGHFSPLVMTVLYRIIINKYSILITIFLLGKKKD